MHGDLIRQEAVAMVLEEHAFEHAQKAVEDMHADIAGVEAEISAGRDLNGTLVHKAKGMRIGLVRLFFVCLFFLSLSLSLWQFAFN